MTRSGHFTPHPDLFDKLYRGEPSFEGAPPPTGIPWDIAQAQPRLMELEAFGGFSGDVLDIGCGLGDNAIFLASRGHSVTALDGSPAGIELARGRAAEAGVDVTFGVADATKLTGYDGRFDTVLDSALFHCLDDEGHRSYVAGLHRATRPGARFHLYCFSDANVNGVIAPRAAVPVDEIHDVLGSNGWRIDFLGPTTYLANTSGMGRDPELIPEQMREQMTAEELQQMREITERFATIAPLLDDDRVHLPMTVVHATRVD